jgi:hypothetical protein
VVTATSIVAKVLLVVIPDDVPLQMLSSAQQQYDTDAGSVDKHTMLHV